MAKRGRATYIARRHGDPNHPIHINHQKSQQNRNEDLVPDLLAGGLQEGDKWPKFETYLKDILDRGFTWQTVRDGAGKIKEVVQLNSDDWNKKLDRLKAVKSRYHQHMKRKNGEKKWVMRKVKDRAKMSKTDKSSRNPSDLVRATWELRPDHTRAIAHLLEANKIPDPVGLILKFAAKKAELFEAIYHRTVTFGAAHSDSGHHHDDLWHDGIEEVVEMVWKEQESGPTQEIETHLERRVFREYGLGPGALAWYRHQQVLQDTMGFEKAISIMGVTADAIVQTGSSVQMRTGEIPRDLRFITAFDSWAWDQLAELGASECLKARQDYSKHLHEGYLAEKLGCIKTSRELRLEQENEALRVELKAVSKQLPSSVLERLDRSSERQEWDRGGTDTDRLLAFIDWLEDSKKALLTQIIELVLPLRDFIEGYPAGKKILKFLGISKSVK